ncbi:MAG: hypothetical protein K2Y71_16605 [Xanthobacteraceae bacterium]|nr:hypothetical protein [Xanthobacteraceae bacterium]
MNARTNKLQILQDRIQKSQRAQVFAIKSLKPSKQANLFHSLGRQFADLDAYLMRLERSVNEWPDYAGKTAILHEIGVAQSQCLQARQTLIAASAQQVFASVAKDGHKPDHQTPHSKLASRLLKNSLDGKT